MFKDKAGWSFKDTGNHDVSIVKGPLLSGKFLCFQLLRNVKEVGIGKVNACFSLTHQFAFNKLTPNSCIVNLM